MTVDIDPRSGFCYGVVRAIRMAEEELRSPQALYSLGDIVHNEQEVERLQATGMTSINHDVFRTMHDAKVLIRAHGEPPATYSLAADNNIELIDATCPVVLKLQQKVARAYERSRTDDGQIVIFGKPHHAEVNGLVGQTDDSALVIASEGEIERIDCTRPVYLFSQTTMPVVGFRNLCDAIGEMRRQRHCEHVPFEINDTICRQVSSREQSLKIFAESHDVVVFVSGSKSSNGKALYAVCQEANTRSYLISKPDDLDISMFADAETIGVCGATSTPRWLMEEVANFILYIFKKSRTFATKLE